MTQDHFTSRFPLLGSYPCRILDLLMQKEENLCYSFMCLVMRVMIPRGSGVLFLPGALVIYNRCFVHCSCGFIKENGSEACMEPASYIESSNEEILLLISLAGDSVYLFVERNMSTHHHEDGDHMLVTH